MDGRSGRGSPFFALTGLALSVLLTSLGISITNVALPAIALAFAAGFQQVQWVVLAYLLVVTILVVGAGRLGDVIGRRRLLLAGIALFASASVVCAASPVLWILIAGRVAQAMGAAVMMALSMALVGEAVPAARSARAMGLLATMSAAGTALGPSLGGILIAGFGWRAIFLTNVPLGALAFLLVRRQLSANRPSQHSDRPRFDMIGTLVLGLTLAAYALAMTVGRGAFGIINVSLLAGALAGGAVFIWFERRATAPLVRPSLFKDPMLGAGLLANALVSTVMMATLVVGPFYLSHALGLGAAAVGLVLSVGPVVAASTGIPAGHAADRFGAFPVAVIGLAAIAGGSLLLAVMPLEFGIAGYVASIVTITFGYGLFQTANNSAVMADSGPGDRGVVSGMLNLSRNIGLITGASLMGAIFVHASGVEEIASARPEAVAAAMRITFAVAAALVLAAIAAALCAHALARRPAAEAGAG
jgi:MFS family permease